METVSIIIPVYNLENSIEECIRTVLEQTYKSLQIILVDDGSTDRSLEICRRFERIDTRVSVLHHENRGVSYTRNRGIDFATGQYLMFIDGDDTVSHDMVEQYVTTARKKNADTVIGGIRIIENGKQERVLLPKKCGEYGGEIWNEICTETSGLFGYVPNKLYRLELIKKNHVQFDVNRSAQEDLDFALSAFDKSERFVLIPYAGYIYIHNSNKRSNHPYEQYIENKIKILKCAAAHCELKKDGEDKIVKDIEELLYVALYESRIENMPDVCNEYGKITGLQAVLAPRKQLNFVTRMFRSGNVTALKLYFISRKKVSKLIHRNAELG